MDPTYAPVPPDRQTAILLDHPSERLWTDGDTDGLTGLPTREALDRLGVAIAGDVRGTVKQATLVGGGLALSLTIDLR